MTLSGKIIAFEDILRYYSGKGKEAYNGNKSWHHLWMALNLSNSREFKEIYIKWTSSEGLIALNIQCPILPPIHLHGLFSGFDLERLKKAFKNIIFYGENKEIYSFLGHIAEKLLILRIFCDIIVVKERRLTTAINRNIMALNFSNSKKSKEIYIKLTYLEGFLMCNNTKN